MDKLRLESRPFPNPLTPAAGSTVIDLWGETHYAETLEDLPPLFREVATAYEAALEHGAKFSDLKAAIRDRNPGRIKEIWDPIARAWDERTFYDFVASSEAFQGLSFKHREVFGQVGFGTGGWDSDFPNSMLEICASTSPSATRTSASSSGASSRCRKGCGAGRRRRSRIGRRARRSPR